MNPYKYSMDLSSFFKEEPQEAPAADTGIMTRNVSRAAAQEPKQPEYDPYSFMPDFANRMKTSFGAKNKALNLLGGAEEDATEDARMREIQATIKGMSQRGAIEDALMGLSLPETPQDMPSAGTLGPLEGTQTLPAAPSVFSSPLGPRNMQQPELDLSVNEDVLATIEDSGNITTSAPELQGVESIIDEIMLGRKGEEGITEETPQDRNERGRGGLMSKKPDNKDVPMPKASGNALLDFIGEGEGTYDSANRGTDSAGNIVGSQLTAERGGKKVSELTIAEIRKYQAIKDPNNDDRLFTVGKYQTIPGTFEEAVKGLGLSDDTVFTPEVQDKVGMYLVSKKRPKLGKFLQGNESVSTDQAMLELAKEFASAPVPFAIKKGAYGSWPKTDLVAGDSFYKDPRAASGNRASHSLEKTRKMLNSVRGMLSN